MTEHISWETLPDNLFDFKFTAFNTVRLIRSIGSDPLKWLSANDRYVRNFKFTISDGKDPSSRLLTCSDILN